MAATDVNRSGEMDVFIRVVEQGGFSAAARVAGLTRSAVSKLVSGLEIRLGARLINRSTRAFQLTPEGCFFYERAIRILADIQDAERGVGAGELPLGRVRLSTSASYATHILAPVLPKFLDLFPGLALDIVQTDSVVDLLSERVDVAVRAGPLKSSSLVARKLGDTAMIIAGAPSYFERFPVPVTIEDLVQHTPLGFGYVRAVDGWPLMQDGRTVVLPAASRVQASDGEALRQLALSGSGLVRLAAFTVRADIAAGRLRAVLEKLNPGDREVFHAIHIGQNGPLPSRVRTVLDFLGEYGRISG